MNASAVIAVAIVTAVVSGVLAFATLARRGDARCAGLLSAETCRRDQPARTDTHPLALTDATHRSCSADQPDSSSSGPRGHRTGGIDSAGPRDPWRQPTPVLQSRNDLDGRGWPRHLLSSQLHRVPVADKNRRFRQQGGRRQHPRRRRFLLRARGTSLDHRIPRRGTPQSRRRLSNGAARQHTTRHHDPVPEVPTSESVTFRGRGQTAIGLWGGVPSGDVVVELVVEHACSDL